MESSPRFVFCKVLIQKKQKEQKKKQNKNKKIKRLSHKVAKCHDNYIFVAKKPQADTRRNVATIGTLSRQILRTLLQKAKKCFLRHFIALSRQKAKNSPRRQLKIIATFQTYVATQYKLEGRRSLSRHFATLSPQRTKQMAAKLCRYNYQTVSTEVCHDISQLFCNKRRNKAKKVCRDNKYFCHNNHSRKMSLTKAAGKSRQRIKA